MKYRTLVRFRNPRGPCRASVLRLCAALLVMTALPGGLCGSGSACAQAGDPRSNTGNSGSGNARSDTGNPAADDTLVPGSTIYQTRHFRVICNRNAPALQAVGSMLEQVLPKLAQSMRASGLPVKPPAEPLPWFCFDDREQYRRHTLAIECVGLSFPESYYSTRTNHVVVYYGATPDSQRGETDPRMPDSSLHLLDVPSKPANSTDPAAVASNRVLILTHELAHQLAFSAGLQKAGVMYPLWVSEGLATYFERSALSGTGTGTHTIRKQRLAELGRTHQLLPLEDLAVLGGPSAPMPVNSAGFRPSSVDVYAQCWGLFGFLLEHYPQQLSAYLMDVGQTPAGSCPPSSLQEDFTRHFGPLDALEQAWLQFVDGLAEPAQGS